MAKKLYLEEIDKLISNTVSKTDRLLLETYKKSLIEINSIMNTYYIKYSTDGILKISEMYKYERFKNMQKEIFKEIGNLSNIKKSELIRLSEASFTQAYSLSFNIVSNEIVASSFTYVHPDKEVIKASVNNKIEKMNLNKRLLSHQVEVRKNITDEITQGLIQGESYYKISRRIRNTLEDDRKKAMKVARTESHRNQMAGRQASFEELKQQGANIKKEWLATSDNRTRDTHKDLNGQRVPVDGYYSIKGYKAKFPGDFGIAKEDINCRCTSIIVLD